MLPAHAPLLASIAVARGVADGLARTFAPSAIYDRKVAKICAKRDALEQRIAHGSFMDRRRARRQLRRLRAQHPEILSR